MSNDVTSTITLSSPCVASRSQAYIYLSYPRSQNSLSIFPTPTHNTIPVPNNTTEPKELWLSVLDWKTRVPFIDIHAYTDAFSAQLEILYIFFTVKYISNDYFGLFLVSGDLQHILWRTSSRKINTSMSCIYLILYT